MRNRFPIFDVTPSVYFGGEFRPAKAVTDAGIVVVGKGEIVTA